MKVIEKYLTMSVEKQTEETSVKLYPDGVTNSLEYNQLKRVITYLNSEVEQDPLEKLGYERMKFLAPTQAVAWFNTDGEIIKINECGLVESYSVEDDVPVIAPLHKTELKAILEIMEGMS